MPELSNAYAQGAADWRKSLKINSRKTFFVISLFFLIYASLGLLVDLYLAGLHWPGVPLPLLFRALITLQITPVATLAMLGVAAISLLITFSFHDRLMLAGTDYHEVTPETATSAEALQLYNIVLEMKIAAGLRFMPRLFIINAAYLNAFASGYSEKSAMIAVTRGLMDTLNRSEMQAVIAHELSHIRHMDIRLTLMASVLANLMVMVLDMLFYSILFQRHRNHRNGGNAALFAIIMLLRYLLPLINIILLLYLSRTREYMADAGSVQLLRDNKPLATALLKIQENYAAGNSTGAEVPHEAVRREAYIYDPAQAGFTYDGSLFNIFSSHPSLADRLKAIGFRQRSE